MKVLIRFSADFKKGQMCVLKENSRLGNSTLLNCVSGLGIMYGVQVTSTSLKTLATALGKGIDKETLTININTLYDLLYRTEC